MEHGWKDFARRSKSDEGNWNYFCFAVYRGGDGDIFVVGRGIMAAQRFLWENNLEQRKYVLNSSFQNISESKLAKALRNAFKIKSELTVKHRGTQREIWRKRPKNNKKIMNKAFWSRFKHFGRLLGKIYLFLTSSKTNGRVLCQQGTPTTCNLT